MAQASTSRATASQVGTSRQRPPGISIRTPKVTFVPWAALKVETEKKIPPQVLTVPAHSTVSLASFKGKENWLVVVTDPSGAAIANVWFGPDPQNHWQWDGLIRIGLPNRENPEEPSVWQTFQRYSDGSYRRK